MAYREVNMLEIQEVLRLWLLAVPIKAAARQLYMDPQTIRRYTRAAEGCGLSKGEGAQALTEEKLQEVLRSLQHPAKGTRGEGWDICQANAEFIRKHLGGRVKLSKIHKLLRRNGVEISYSTLYRFARSELDFSRRKLTIPLSPCGPGEELQVDTARVGRLEPDAQGKRTSFKAWIFTSVFSRHRFVFPSFQERTVDAIRAFEAAWQFFGGVFRVVIPDNTKAIVDNADPLKPRLNATFVDYMQHRGFIVDAARVRRPTDKGKVERAVQTVRDDCFGGETIRDIAHAQEIATDWCIEDYGARKHSTTLRRPFEMFESEERPRLLTWPGDTYDVPIWAHPKVARDQHATVAKALYSLPAHYVGECLTARADQASVKFYSGKCLVKTHPRMQPGERSTHDCDFPAEKVAVAKRNLKTFVEMAFSHGEAVGAYSQKLLDVPYPWASVRRVIHLLGLCNKFGGPRVNDTCALAQAADMYDVKRLTRMLEICVTKAPPEPSNVIPLGKYLRPNSAFALRKSNSISPQGKKAP